MRHTAGPVQASALLKNLDNTLPLQAWTSGLYSNPSPRTHFTDTHTLPSQGSGTVAVIGPNANLSKSDTSYYGDRHS